MNQCGKLVVVNAGGRFYTLKNENHFNLQFINLFFQPLHALVASVVFLVVEVMKTDAIYQSVEIYMCSRLDP